MIYICITFGGIQAFIYVLTRISIPRKTGFTSALGFTLDVVTFSEGRTNNRLTAKFSILALIMDRAIVIEPFDSGWKMEKH